jgi:hypothetical protein
MPGRDEESGLHHRGNDHWVGLNWLRQYLADASLTRQRSSCAINITNLNQLFSGLRPHGRHWPTMTAATLRMVCTMLVPLNRVQ